MKSFHGSYILVVDDLVDNLLLLQTLLESEGYHVEVADSGELALEKIRTLPPNLVLLDVMMPQMNGYELTQIVRQDDRLSAIPIILVTAHRDVHVTHGLLAGANDFIYKPIDADEVLTKVKNFVNSAAVE